MSQSSYGYWTIIIYLDLDKIFCVHFLCSSKLLLSYFFNHRRNTSSIEQFCCIWQRSLNSHTLFASAESLCKFSFMVNFSRSANWDIFLYFWLLHLYQVIVFVCGKESYFVIYLAPFFSVCEEKGWKLGFLFFFLFAQFFPTRLK